MNMTAGKMTQKKSRDAQKAFIVKALSEKYHVTEALVYMAIRGDRKTELAETIRRDYFRLYDKISLIVSGQGCK